VCVVVVCVLDIVRFQKPEGFTDVRPNSSDIWWEDVAGNGDKELWLVRAPANVSAIGLCICRVC